MLPEISRLRAARNLNELNFPMVLPSSPRAAAGVARAAERSATSVLASVGVVHPARDQARHLADPVPDRGGGLNAQVVEQPQDSEQPAELALGQAGGFVRLSRDHQRDLRARVRGFCPLRRVDGAGPLIVLRRVGCVGARAGLWSCAARPASASAASSWSGAGSGTSAARAGDAVAAFVTGPAAM